MRYTIQHICMLMQGSDQQVGCSLHAFEGQPAVDGTQMSLRTEPATHVESTAVCAFLSLTCSCVRSPVMVGRCLYWLWLRSSSCRRMRLPMPLVRPRSLLLDISSCCSAVQRPTTRGTLVRRLPLQSSTCRALKAPRASGRDCRRLRARRSTCWTPTTHTKRKSRSKTCLYGLLHKLHQGMNASSTLFCTCPAQPATAGRGACLHS